MDPIQLLVNRTDLPPGIDINLVTPFLLPLPSKFSDNTAYNNKICNHYKDVLNSLQEKIPICQKMNDESVAALEEKKQKQPDPIDNQPQIRNEIILYNVLFKMFKKLDIKIEETNLGALSQQLEALKQLEILAQWLFNNPMPIIINVQRAAPRPLSKSFTSNQTLYKHYRILKIALREQISLINHSPSIFNMASENRAFLRKVVDSAMASRKANTAYFESPVIEEKLFTFFDHVNSPISRAGLIPIKVEKDTDAAIDWIRRASDTLVQLDGIQISDRKDVINVLVARYFFERTYPLFAPELHDDTIFSQTRQKIRQMNPKEAKIPLKYVNPNLLDKPVTEIFTSSSIASAPVGWMNLMEYKLCPLDVAYCIFKVHESLSIAATLQATENSKGTTSEDFYSKLPGFDDIFDLWICLVATSDIADPCGMNNFIGEWTRLPGFPQRFVACCTYLEAAVSQIKVIGGQE